MGVVGRDGSVAAFTGDECLDVAGDVQGDGYTVQGNVLENRATLTAMAEAFRRVNNFENHSLAALEDALAHGWPETDRTRTPSPDWSTRSGTGSSGFRDDKR